MNFLNAFLKFKASSAVILAAALIAVYSSTLRFDFVSYDDYGHLHENPAVTSFNWQQLKNIWTEPRFGLYIPVTYTVWAVEFQMARHLPEPPLIFHATNVLIHTVNSFLVGGLFLGLGLSAHWALLGSLLFALHPLQVESVAWISSLRDLLSAFWGLLFVLWGLRKLAPPAGLLKLRDCLILTFFLALCFLSKPAGVVFLAIGPLVWVFRGLKLSRVLAGLLVLWSAMAAGVIATSKMIQSAIWVDFHPSLSEKLFLMASSLSFYVRKIIWPTELSPDYGISSQRLIESWKASGWPWGELAFFILVLGLLAAGLFKRKTWGLGLAVALAAWAPVSGLVNFNFQNTSVVADRYLYLSLAGIALCLISIFSSFQSPVLQKALIAASGLVTLVLGTLSFQQSAIWKNDESLYTRILQLNERSFSAWGWFGYQAMVSGDWARAEELLQKSVDLRPSNRNARYNLAKVQRARGYPQQALQNLVTVINTDPQFEPAYAELTDLLISQGRWSDAAEAVRRGLQVAPETPILWVLRGMVSANQGALDQALSDFQKVLALDPLNFDAHKNLFLIYRKMNDVDQASKHLQLCYQIDRERASRENLRL